MSHGISSQNFFIRLVNILSMGKQDIIHFSILPLLCKNASIS